MFEHKSQADYVIIGCGRLGARLATDFSEQGKSVLIIDRLPQSFRKLSRTYGGLTLEADATDCKTLKNAGINKNTQVIIVTNDDNVNIMVAQIVKYYFQVEHVIARLYDPEHACAYEEFGIETISPVLLSVDAIAEMVKRKER